MLPLPPEKSPSFKINPSTGLWLSLALVLKKAEASSVMS